MRIVDLKEFRALPPGTVFMKYEPCVFERLSVKGKTLEADFLYADLTTEIYCSGSEEMMGLNHQGPKPRGCSQA